MHSGVLTVFQAACAFLATDAADAAQGAFISYVDVGHTYYNVYVSNA